MAWRDHKDDAFKVALIAVLSTIAYLTYVGNYYSAANNRILYERGTEHKEILERCGR
jgi:hypothetical protein